MPLAEIYVWQASRAADTQPGANTARFSSLERYPPPPTASVAYNHLLGRLWLVFLLGHTLIGSGCDFADVCGR